MRENEGSIEYLPYVSNLWELFIFPIMAGLLESNHPWDVPAPALELQPNTRGPLQQGAKCPVYPDWAMDDHTLATQKISRRELPEAPRGSSSQSYCMARVAPP